MTKIREMWPNGPDKNRQLKKMTEDIYFKARKMYEIQLKNNAINLIEFNQELKRLDELRTKGYPKEEE